MKGSIMNQNAPDDMRAEYNFTNAVQGKHHRAYAEGTNVVLLEADVARVFRDSASVNKALRLLIEIAHNQTAKNAQQ
jgi:hypothetical protein